MDKMFDARILKALIKQKEKSQTPEMQEAIKEQERLSQIMREKRESFYKLQDQYISLLRTGTEKFLSKYPQYKDDLPSEDIQILIAKKALDVAINNPSRITEMNKHMDEIEELKKSNELNPSIMMAFYEYLVAFTDFENRLKEDRKKLFSNEYMEKMSEYADNGVLLYFLETPDFPLLDPDISANDFLDSLFYGQNLEVLFYAFFQVENAGVSMAHKLDDLDVTLLLIRNEHYRSAARNLFALIESEHKKAANSYEGIIKRRRVYKKGLDRAKKIDELVSSLKDEWISVAWKKVDQYYKKVVATIPVDGVVHRNSIVHGDYDNSLIEVDRYAAVKLLLLWLNMRVIADNFCNQEELFDHLLQYLPAIIVYLKNKSTSKKD